MFNISFESFVESPKDNLNKKYNIKKTKQNKTKAYKNKQFSFTICYSNAISWCLLFLFLFLSLQITVLSTQI